MDLNANDLQLCLLKILKLSSKTCLSYSLKHPFVSISLISLFIIYIFFPTIFWVLVYSFPLVVSIVSILGIHYSIRNGKRCLENDKQDGTSSSAKKISFPKDNVAANKKSCMRVHSVRRRREKNIIRRDQEDKEEKEDEVFSTKTNLEDQIVDKNPLIEEIPKEIREVEVDSSQVSTTKSSSDEEGGEDENKAAVQWTEDDQKNVMEIGISEIERNKRLESLIARRRARKLLTLQVRRTLMNMDNKNDHPSSQLASIVIPRHTNPYHPGSQPLSPVPGSAPSILVPMRNPFDLPYDPQEEKPDLTGDSFQQEFTSGQNKDMMFCRHESFRSGAFLPGDLDRDRDREQTMFFHGFGLRQRDYSSQAYQSSKLGALFDRELTRIIEREPAQVSSPKQNNDGDGDDDQIKEVIQVYKNGTDAHQEENIGEIHTKPTLEEDSSSTTSSSSSSSTEEDAEPFFKIDKEAILRSLCSPARRNIPQNRYGGSPFEKTSLEEHIYYANRSMPRHRPSYSIASDMQVEVSDVSSPPLTIDENLSCKDEDISMYDGNHMEKKTGYGSEDSLASSSHLFGVDENESRSVEVNEVSGYDVKESGFSKFDDKTMKDLDSHSNPELRLDNGQVDSLRALSPDENLVFSDNEGVQQSTRTVATYPSNENDFGNQTRELETTGNIETGQHSESEESSTTQATLGSDDPQILSLNVQQIPAVQSSLLSPKSVLQTTFSVGNGLSSFDERTDQGEPQPIAQTLEMLSPISTQIPTPLVEHPTAGDTETSQEPSESSRTTTMGADNTLSSDVAGTQTTGFTNSTSSNSSEVTRDDIQNLVADQSLIGPSAPVEYNENSESPKNSKPSRNDEQHVISNESRPESEDNIETK